MPNEQIPYHKGWIAISANSLTSLYTYRHSRHSLTHSLTRSQQNISHFTLYIVQIFERHRVDGSPYTATMSIPKYQCDAMSHFPWHRMFPVEMHNMPFMARTLPISHWYWQNIENISQNVFWRCIFNVLYIVRCITPAIVDVAVDNSMQMVWILCIYYKWIVRLLTSGYWLHC